MLEDGRVKIGLEFRFNPVWQLVNEAYSSTALIVKSTKTQFHY